MTDNNWSTYFTAFLLIIPVLLTGTGATNGRSLCLNTVFDARDNVLVTYQNHTVWLTDMSAGDRPILVGTAYFPEVRRIDAALLINDTTGPCNELGAPCLSLYLIDGKLYHNPCPHYTT
ncbi:unnamed protein product [Oppiella nova]|uniref:Uncharacterized protein n=1 Tax=Oppiella nova TaxID=334625 RepID=A0A7R9MGP5_9ACAR|nr:unnamed protein product [Oppiella nova]CAG2177059.1 unnamed protein product [Oppiella nova]